MLADGNTTIGWVTIRLIGPDRRVRERRLVRNTITDAGDAYHAARVATGIGSSPVTAPTPVTGIKLGTGTTAAAKNGPGAQLGAYAAGAGLDAGFPTVTASAGNGAVVTYQCTWPGGTGGAFTAGEAILCTDATTAGTSAAAATIARVVFAPIPRHADDELIVKWQHINQGGAS